MSEQPAARPRRLGDILLDESLITPDQLQIALLEQRERGGRLGEILTELGFVSTEIINDLVGSATGHESLDLDSVVVDDEGKRLLPREVAQRFHVLPVSYDAEGAELVLAMADTFDILALDHVRNLLGNGVRIRPVLADRAQIAAAIDRVYGFELSIDGILGELERATEREDTEEGRVEGYDHPVVRLVDALLADAAKRGASDIHFEPEQGFLRIRYRIDGVLRQIRVLHKKYWPAISVRLKVASGMNIAETRAPQDGRISRTVGGRAIDYRVASQPTLHGENFVLRILDRSKGITPLEQLDIPSDVSGLIRRMIARPEGIVLVTGPTGSGKTTTLYSILDHLNRESVNIMTLEDPVEYPIPMIRQSNIGQSGKMDFAEGIRSLMRQDPDVILVGEIRDLDTATMALRAAMTGHQVFSTLHTNSAVGVFPRLMDIGVSAEMIAGNLIGVIAQRLVRRLCPECRTPYEPDGEERALLGAEGERVTTLYKAAGCRQCDHQGYRGRVAIMEVLRMDARLDELVAKHASIHLIEEAARERGFRTLAERAIERVLDGTTSLAEAERVIALGQRD